MANPKPKKVKRKDRKDVLAELGNPDGDRHGSDGKVEPEPVAVPASVAGPEKSSVSSHSSSLASQEDDFLGSDVQVSHELQREVLERPVIDLCDVRPCS